MEKDVLKNIELIEAYFENKLNAEDKAAFDAKLLVDGDLRDEVILYKSIIAGIQEAGNERLRSKLKEVDKELDGKSKIISITHLTKNTYYKLLAAASIILLIGISFYFFIQKQSLEKNIALYEETETGLPVLMGKGLTKDFDKAMSHYKEGEYKISLAEFEKLNEVNPDNDTILYFSGVNAYNLNNYTKTINYLKKISPNAKSPFRFKAAYRLGLAYWKNKDKESARKIFLDISKDTENPYKDRAIAILKEL